ncbi:O-methyltransferase [Salibacterium aidingense]|uniref:O-methyltransferase n=1 Tax=Salibacterium aidingense TaxID=384933 RepID=UPI000413CB6A|nr:O-methyltransferase [Salibacterium aidingense]
MSSQEDWAKVDHYITEALDIADTDMENIQKRSAAAGLPSIEVAPNQGKLLQLAVQMSGAEKILEIGTLGGYSTVWMAKALPAAGKLITLEADPRHAEVARANFQSAGYDHLIELREGPALESLPRLEGETFDLIFLDADKENTPAYFKWALRLAHKGTVIICDNVVRRGEVADETRESPVNEGIRRFFEEAAKEPRVNATAVQTVGEKGHDGLAVLIVTEDSSS